MRLEKLLEQLQRCLDLQWCNAESVSERLDDVTENSNAEDASPDPELIISLRDFARIGYLKGVLECIHQLELQTPATQWITQLKILADKCDLDGIVLTVNDLMKLKGKDE